MKLFLKYQYTPYFAITNIAISGDFDGVISEKGHAVAGVFTTFIWKHVEEESVSRE